MTAKQLICTLAACGANRLYELEAGYKKTGRPNASHLKASYRKAKHHKALHRRGREMILLRQNVYVYDLKAAVGATR